MIQSSIDLGTNTCLLLIAEKDPSGGLRVIEDFATVVRLGQGVDQTKALHPDAINRTLSCLKKYADAVKQAGGKPEDTVCVATSSARDAKNGQQFFDQVLKETGFRFQIISGDEEARFTFLGALLPKMTPEKHVVIDIGGGSTEFRCSHSGESLDIGSVRFTERFLKQHPPTDEQFWVCQEAVDRQLEKLKEWRKSLPHTMQLLAVAGTATTLAAWFLGLRKFDAKAIDGLTLTTGDVHRQVEELKWRSVAEREALPGIEPGRADVLLAGALILWRSMEILDFPNLQISSRGLRFGILSSLK
jgi:exopolyphosphatase/guanosine-5'-triphosphate,3'-diphosphate pyrophosphatase